MLLLRGVEKEAQTQSGLGNIKRPTDRTSPKEQLSKKGQTYFLAHAAGSGGCDNYIKSTFSGDSYKSIAFCSIRGGGRGSGGVILYEKKLATDLAPVIAPSKKRSTRHRRQLSGRFGDIL